MVCTSCTASAGATVTAGLDLRLTVVAGWPDEFGLTVFGVETPDSAGGARTTVVAAPSALATIVSWLGTTTT